MDILKQIDDMVNSTGVQFGLEIPKDLHTRLVIHQTRHVCRYGTLSDGFEKLTDAQRYYQAIRELYSLAQNIAQQQALAFGFQADILDAEEALASAQKESEKLRAKSQLFLARGRLQNALVIIKDQMRMVDEYNKIREELAPAVEAKYPGGIEQAEMDNWKAVYEYRKLSGDFHNVANIPLPPVEKAKLGVEYQCMRSIAPAIVAEKDEFERLPNEDPQKLKRFIQNLESNMTLIEGQS
jgi:hypothetical protein